MANNKDMPDITPLRNVWKNNVNNLGTDRVELDRLEVDKLIAAAFSSGPFYFFILDTTGANMSLDYVSPEIEDLHGLRPETVKFQDILEQTHPDDADFVARAEAKAFEILMKLPPERRNKYKVSYCFRFRVRDGSFRLFSHQAIMLATTSEGRLLKSLNIHTDISHLAEANNYRLSLIGLLDEPSYLNIDIGHQSLEPAPSHKMFTKREVEVIQLLSQGYTSRDIAEVLHIAENTVKNHRKSILSKAGAKNVSQLIAKCITEGLL
ncbi:LuxR C-terminal-related transcriptional regulator [Microbulbifer sp. SAOS-129_SWC]|uniref:helix-turn-helix transcriptional regulator n=1 Tax=Microbulbifer sp. SAOS-129_SWC TaxID=3145235 RepID=UPI003216B39C